MRSSLVILAFLLTLSAPAWAQQNDTRGLVDRLDRLERDLNSLQSQVYRGGGSRSGGSSSGGGDANLSGNVYAMLDDRINKLEAQMQDLTGQIEKTQFDINQLTSKLDRAAADTDFRLKQLEGKGAPAAAPVPETPAPDAGKSANADTGLAPASGFLTHPGDKKEPPPLLPAKPAAEQYDYAFGLLKNSDYDGATKSFQAFLAAHPSDPLAGNAAYWLGQMSFAQGHYDQAAVIFLDAYTKYPKSAKAGESLLKVGLSMANLNKKKEACAALHRFQSEFPDASDSLKRQATAERQKQGC
jgi:tol-pal system protein YbgF